MFKKYFFYQYNHKGDCNTNCFGYCRTFCVDIDFSFVVNLIFIAALV